MLADWPFCRRRRFCLLCLGRCCAGGTGGNLARQKVEERNVFGWGTVARLIVIAVVAVLAAAPTAATTTAAAAATAASTTLLPLLTRTFLQGRLPLLSLLSSDVSETV